MPAGGAPFRLSLIARWPVSGAGDPLVGPSSPSQTPQPCSGISWNWLLSRPQLLVPGIWGFVFGSGVWAPVTLEPRGGQLGAVWTCVSGARGCGVGGGPADGPGDWAGPQGLGLLCQPYGTVPGTQSKAF